MKKLLLLFFLMTISLGQSQTPAAGPSAPATRNSWDVLSQYGSAYVNQPGVDFNSFGGATIVGDVTLADNSIVKKYTGHSYSGISTNGSYNLNVSGMTKLHIDVWSPDFVSFKIKLEAANGSNRELEVPFTKTQGSWNSYDLDLSTYTGVDLANLRWIVPVTFGPNNTTLFITNVYFWRPATSQPATLGALTVPAQLVGAAPFALTPPTTNSAGAITYSSSNTAVATISGSTVTVLGAGTSIITATQAATSSYTSASTTANLVVSYPPPTVAANTPPTRNSSNVISIFSGTYTDISGTDFFPNWGQSTAVSDYTVAGNATKKYSNLNYQGTNLGPINVSLMTNLHLDIWTPDCTSFQVFLIGGGENAVTLTPTLSGWNSFDIPMSSYAARTLTSIAQFKYVGTTGSTVYLDNIYFWKPEGSPTITGFSIPTKVIGGSSFSLVAPTSDSSGTFSYTSSNTSVATISGSTVTIVGIGSSTITATQAAGGGFSSGFVTADLIVTPPAAPTPTVASSHVLSLYSDAYTNVASINWNPNWGQSTQASDLSIEGNNTKKYTNLNYQGVQLAATLDVSAMQTLHIDIWTPDCTTFNVFLVNQPNPEKSVALTPSLSGWNSFDIDLPLFTGAGGINLANIGQLKFTGNGTVYVDNIYFSDVVVAHAPSITLSNSIKVIGDANFTLSASSASAGAMTYSSSNTSVATISGATVTIVGVGTTTITVNQDANGNYLVGTATATLTVNPSTPTTAATTPPARNAWDVVSFYSDAYSNVANVDFFPDWGQGTTLQAATIQGNATLNYKNLDYQGIVFSATNVANMTKLHIDIWTPNVTPFKISIIGGGEFGVTLTPTLSGWNNYEIDMSNFSGNNLTSILQFKLEKPGFAYHAESNTIYIDNIYFWRAATTQPPTMGSFTVPAKVLGNSAFNLTAPTSNSRGAFTYTSSNTSVATIVGRTVTIVGAGTSVITATQAANGGYSTGTAFASLVVSYPSPTTAPASPTKDSSRVISIFSDRYTNVAGTAFFQQWGSGTTGSTIQIGTNNIQKYANFSYVGTQFASPIDASTMQMLHLDIWTPDCTAFKISLISNGENAVTLTPTLSGWNSFDIDLTQYSVAGRNLAAISQFKFERDGSGTKTVYLDNIYFAKAPSNHSIAPIASPISYCYGATAVPLTATENGGDSLIWYNDSNILSVLPSAPTPVTTTIGTRTYYVAQVMPDGFVSPRTSLIVTTLALPSTPGTISGVTNQGGIVGTTTTAQYTFTSIANATSYVWTTPAGVNIISGQGTTTLTVNFSGVALTAGTIGNITVKSVNASGCSSALRTLTVSALVPNSVSNVSGQTVGICSGSSYNYSITAPLNANSYLVTGPVGSIVKSASNSSNNSNVLTTSDLVFSVLYPSNFETLSNKTITVVAKNSCGNSTESKTITVATSMPTIVFTGNPRFDRAIVQTYSVANFEGITNYVWWCTNGATIVSGQGTNSVVVSFVNVASNLSAAGIGLQIENSCGLAISKGTLLTLLPSTAREENTSFDITKTVESDLSVKVYPNPFTSNFKLDFISSSESNVEIVIYDMIGRQLERLQVGSSEINNLELGNNYPSGVYNVIVKQGEDVKTLRVIKR